MEEPIATVEALRDGRLIVWSREESRRLYRQGYYGKPLGVSKPKEDFDAPLILDPIEGLYLLERGIIRVRDPDGSEMDAERLRGIARETMDRFDEKYLIYRDLRDRGYIVTPGIKYGCDFAVYRYGPGIDHAPYIVEVRRVDEELSASEIVRSGRLATTVRKTFIIAAVEGNRVRYLGFEWWKP